MFCFAALPFWPDVLFAAAFAEHFPAMVGFGTGAILVGAMSAGPQMPHWFLQSNQ